MFSFRYGLLTGLWLRFLSVLCPRKFAGGSVMTISKYSIVLEGRPNWRIWSLHWTEVWFCCFLLYNLKYAKRKQNLTLGRMLWCNHSHDTAFGSSKTNDVSETSVIPLRMTKFEKMRITHTKRSHPSTVFTNTSKKRSRIVFNLLQMLCGFWRRPNLPLPNSLNWQFESFRKKIK